MEKKSVFIYPAGGHMLSDVFMRILENCEEAVEAESIDTVMLLVDEYTAGLFEKSYFSFMGKKVIAYIAELNYKTIPLVKLADFVFYQDENQRKLAELVMEFGIPYKILPLPYMEPEYTKGFSKEAGIYKNYHPEEGVLEKLPKGTKYDICEDQAKFDDISEKISQGDKTAIYYTLDGNLRRFLLNVYAHIPLEFKGEKGDCVTFEAFKAEILQAIEEAGSIRKYPVVPDRFKELNVISGTVLSNRFIFSVCYRNQPNKVLRCIQSICMQNKELDFGVAVIDDMSEDGLVQQIKTILKDYGIDHVIVRNKERKYAPKNFYNIIHCLVSNDDSYIIELDGDDYLYTSKALDTLNEAVRNEPLKTIGNVCVDNGRKINFKVFERERAATDFNCPRNVSKCAAWYPLRMTKRRVLKNIEIEHFLETGGSNWLRFNHDTSVHSRAIELSKDQIALINEELYAYDTSGGSHDTSELMEEFEHESWSYGTFLLDNSYLFRLYIPIFEEPQKIPSSVQGKGLEDNPYFK